MKKLSLILLSLGFFVVNANAEATLTAPTLDLSNVVIVAGALLTGAAGMWAITKAIGLFGRNK